MCDIKKFYLSEKFNLGPPLMSARLDPPLAPYLYRYYIVS